MTMRLLIADDHELTRAGLRAVIEREPDLQVAAEAATAEEAVDRVALGDIDVAVLDVRFGPGMNGLDAARRILATSRTRVLMLTLHDTPEYVRSALTAGATGFVLKDAGRVELLDAIRAVGSGRTALPGDLLRRAVEPRVGPHEADLARLTARERQVLALVADGLTNKAIARELGIGPGTVKAHVEKVIAKLGVADRTQAAVFATRASG
jgi:DNA-binding NarL/FixJ family response regulator